MIRSVLLFPIVFQAIHAFSWFPRSLTPGLPFDVKVSLPETETKLLAGQSSINIAVELQTINDPETSTVEYPIFIEMRRKRTSWMHYLTRRKITKIATNLVLAMDQTYQLVWDVPVLVEPPVLATDSDDDVSVEYEIVVYMKRAWGWYTHNVAKETVLVKPAIIESEDGESMFDKYFDKKDIVPMWLDVINMPINNVFQECLASVKAYKFCANPHHHVFYFLNLRRRYELWSQFATRNRFMKNNDPFTVTNEHLIAALDYELRSSLFGAGNKGATLLKKVVKLWQKKFPDVITDSQILIPSLFEIMRSFSNSCGKSDNEQAETSSKDPGPSEVCYPDEFMKNFGKLLNSYCSLRSNKWEERKKEEPVIPPGYNGRTVYSSLVPARSNSENNPVVLRKRMAPFAADGLIVGLIIFAIAFSIKGCGKLVGMMRKKEEDLYYWFYQDEIFYNPLSILAVEEEEEEEVAVEEPAEPQSKKPLWKVVLPFIK